MKTWKTSTGIEIPYRKIEDGHLLNILAWIQRKAKTGLIQSFGCMGSDNMDIFYDEETIYGDEVLEHFDFAGLMKEVKRRKFKGCKR